jgi:hypothetical protein
MVRRKKEQGVLVGQCKKIFIASMDMNKVAGRSNLGYNGLLIEFPG